MFTIFIYSKIFINFIHFIKKEKVYFLIIIIGQ